MRSACVYMHCNFDLILYNFKVWVQLLSPLLWMKATLYKTAFTWKKADFICEVVSSRTITSRRVGFVVHFPNQPGALIRYDRGVKLIIQGRISIAPQSTLNPHNQNMNCLLCIKDTRLLPLTNKAFDKTSSLDTGYRSSNVKTPRTFFGSAIFQKLCIKDV